MTNTEWANRLHEMHSLLAGCMNEPDRRES